MFNPKSGRFSKIPGAMAQARLDAAAAPLPGGRVLIVGNNHSGTVRVAVMMRPRAVRRVAVPCSKGTCQLATR